MTMAKRIMLFLLLAGFAGVGWCGRATANPPDGTLARQLVEEGDHRSAAVEWRRLGMQAQEPEIKAGLFWASAHQYLQANEPRIADAMLDQAEWASVEIEDAANLLRAKGAMQLRDRRQATFYWSSLQRGADDQQARRMAHRQLAALAFLEGDVEASRRWLETSPDDEDMLLRRLAEFEAGRDKRPRIGGLLGMVPGMGYAYAGEYANAFRSLILNSLFIYGMVDTARNDHWGGFAVITFFEITWYTGSIYGGFDATHRYNQRRREIFLEPIEATRHVEPDWAEIPVVILRFPF